MTAAPKVATVNPGIIYPRNQNKKPLMTSENNPKVMILIGKVTIFIIGLTMRFMTVKKAPTITAIVKESAEMSGIRYATASTASVKTIHWIIIFIEYELRISTCLPAGRRTYEYKN